MVSLIGPSNASIHQIDLVISASRGEYADVGKAIVDAALCHLSPENETLVRLGGAPAMAIVRTSKYTFMLREHVRGPNLCDVSPIINICPGNSGEAAQQIALEMRWRYIDNRPKTVTATIGKPNRRGR